MKSVMESSTQWTVESVFVPVPVILEIPVILCVTAMEHVLMIHVFVMMDIGVTLVDHIPVLEWVNPVVVMEIVIQSLVNAPVIQAGLLIPVMFRIVLENQTAMEMEPVTQMVPCQCASAILVGLVSPVPCHVSMEHHSQTTPVCVILVTRGWNVTSCVVVMEVVIMIHVHVM